MSELKKGMFGITQETKDSNAIPFLVATKVENDPQFPSGWKFPIAKLVNVIANPAFEKKDGDKVAILDFVFADSEKRRYIHREWQQDPNDINFQKKHDGMTIRVNHVYKSIFVNLPPEGIGTEASNYAEFYEAVAKAFNEQVVTVKTETEEKKVKAYTRELLYYKCTYYDGNFGFPLSPNFLEKVEKGKPCITLSINLAYDKLEAKAKATSNIPGMSSNDMPENLPTFEGGDYQ